MTPDDYTRLADLTTQVLNRETDPNNDVVPGTLARALAVLTQRLLARQHETRRWNVEPVGDNLYVCRDLHEKHEPCVYELYVPETRVTAAEQVLVAYQRAIDVGGTTMCEVVRTLCTAVEAMSSLSPEDRRRWSDAMLEAYLHLTTTMAAYREPESQETPK